jgi:hypothetical protein
LCEHSRTRDEGDEECAHLAVVAVVVVVATSSFSLTFSPLVSVAHLHRCYALRLTDPLQHQQHRILRDGISAEGMTSFTVQ